MMTFTDHAQIERIGRGLIDHSLPKAEWTNAAHWAAALWVIRCRPDLPAETQMPGLISRYNVAVGGENTDTAGYHETITQASLLMARRVLAQHPDAPLTEVANALLASPLGERDWMLAYWSRERLFSVAARRGWVDPDLDDLPG